MQRNKLLLLLALLLTAATGAWAANTVTWTAQNQLPTLEGKTTATIDGVTITTPSAITVSSGRATFNVAAFSVTEGNITKIVLKSISGVSDYPTGWTISNYTDATWTGSAKSVSCGYSGGVYSIEFTIENVYTVKMAEGTVDKDNWTINPAEAAEGTAVTIQYNGRLKVKGVKATSDEQEAVLKTPATVTTAPTGATGLTTASAVTEKLVTGGVADGGTLKYAITSTTTQPDDAAFTLTSPTVSDLKTALSMSTLAAGTYYVWYKVFADANHADSEAAYVSVAVAQVITWNSSNVSDLSVLGNWAPPYTKEGVTLSSNGEMNGARWRDNGDESGIRFEVMGSGGFTFTAPNGKAFTKIEMTLNESSGWDIANLGTGWAYAWDGSNPPTVTWTSSSAASKVKLLTDAPSFLGTEVNSIVFYLSDAE